MIRPDGQNVLAVYSYCTCFFNKERLFLDGIPSADHLSCDQQVRPVNSYSYPDLNNLESPEHKIIGKGIQAMGWPEFWIVILCLCLYWRDSTSRLLLLTILKN